MRVLSPAFKFIFLQSYHPFTFKIFIFFTIVSCDTSKYYDADVIALHQTYFLPSKCLTEEICLHNNVLMKGSFERSQAI